MTSTFPTIKQIQKAQQKNVWDFGNKILYDLCSLNFEHKEAHHILTKVLFIGRIYSAAVERRPKEDDISNDDFYTKIIESKFRKSKLDDHLKKLTKTCVSVSPTTIQDILETHSYLTDLLKKITKIEKRSFSSKYLHFHLPDLFFIYDSRASKALNKFNIQVLDELNFVSSLKTIDKNYATFCCKLLTLKYKIQDKYNITLNNRELDNLLLELSKKK